MTNKSITSIELFYSYSHKDEKLRDKLEEHFTLLQREGIISTWHDRKIGAGTEWAGQIDKHLNSAQIILLLISSSFLASDYCYDIEVKRAIERHEAGEAVVIPIILRPTDWHSAIFGKLNGLPKDGKPITSWRNREEAFVDITKGIRKTIEEHPLFSQVQKAEETAHQTKERQSMSSPQNSSSTISGLERPATAFLSYAREDAEEVEYLHQQLKVRGVRTWHDVTDLPLGGSNEEDISEAIKNEVDAFVIYITEHAFKSRFIWTVEIPTALERRQYDRSFNIIPMLRGITWDEMEQFCAARGYRSLKEFNGIRLPNKTTEEDKTLFESRLKEVARRILETTLDLRFKRAGAKGNSTYQPSLCLQTYPYTPPTDTLDLDLNWTKFFPSKDELPDEKVWNELLLPALTDVKNVLSSKTPNRHIHLFVQAHLPAGIALGAALPETSNFTLSVKAWEGFWNTKETASLVDPHLQYTPSTANGDSHVAIMEIAIASETASDVSNNIQQLGISYQHRVHFSLPGGPDHRTGVKDASHALAMSLQVGKELRRLFGKEGVTHIHLFTAIPIALAVLIGHQMNAMGAITLYHFHSEKRLYQPLCTLGKQKR